MLKYINKNSNRDTKFVFLLKNMNRFIQGQYIQHNHAFLLVKLNQIIENLDNKSTISS